MVSILSQDLHVSYTREMLIRVGDLPFTKTVKIKAFPKLFIFNVLQLSTTQQFLHLFFPISEKTPNIIIFDDAQFIFSRFIMLTVFSRTCTFSPAQILH